MAEVTVYGASDDLIEIDGAIYEEFGAHGDDSPNYLAFSDGTVLSVEYANDGCWRVNRVAAGTADYAKVEAIDADSADYSDRVTLTGDISWVVHGLGFAPAKTVTPA